MLTALLITCASLVAVDGETIKCDGVNMRDMGDGAPFVSGYDTPEIRDAKCDAERRLGQVAKGRMEQLLATPGIEIVDSGQRDKTRSRRPLVWIKLPDGRTVGNVCDVRRAGAEVDAKVSRGLVLDGRTLGAFET